MRRAVPLLLLLITACTAEPAPAEPEPAVSPPDGLTDAEWGEMLFRDHGCTACHTINGIRLVGGPLDRIWGQERSFADGTSGKVDEAYLEESILDPEARIVQGYLPQMPSYRTSLDEDEVSSLIAYLRSLR